MITIDATISLLAGSGLAMSLPANSTANESVALKNGLIYQSCILSPVILYFMTRYPDWEWNYFFDARQFFMTQSMAGSLVWSILFSLLGASFWLGFSATRKFERKRPGSGKLFAAASSIVLLVTSALISSRAIELGQYLDFQNNVTVKIWNDIEFLLTLFASSIVVGIPYLLLLRKTRSEFFSKPL